jgi:hypothetical protein
VTRRHLALPIAILLLLLGFQSLAPSPEYIALLGNARGAERTLDEELAFALEEFSAANGSAAGAPAAPAEDRPELLRGASVPSPTKPSKPPGSPDPVKPVLLPSSRWSLRDFFEAGEDRPKLASACRREAVDSMWDLVESDGDTPNRSVRVRCPEYRVLLVRERHRYRLVQWDRLDRLVFQKELELR